jgi:cytoskeleton protein RodZ
LGDVGIGETLRSAREEQGRTIEEAARDTRVRGDYLRALEDDRFDVFGGDVYAKGFLSTYARYLRLDPNPLLERYRRYVQHDSYDTAALAAGPVARGTSRRPPAWVGGLIVVLLLVVAAGTLLDDLPGRAPDQAEQSPPPQPVASPTPSVTETAEPSPTATPTPTFDGVQLEVSFTGSCWVRVTVDGEVTVEGTQAEGTTLTLEDDEQVTVRFGLPANATVVLNGEDLGQVAETTSPLDVTFTSDGADTA